MRFDKLIGLYVLEDIAEIKAFKIKKTKEDA